MFNLIWKLSQPIVGNPFIMWAARQISYINVKVIPGLGVNLGCPNLCENVHNWSGITFEPVPCFYAFHGNTLFMTDHELISWLPRVQRQSGQRALGRECVRHRGGGDAATATQTPGWGFDPTDVWVERELEGRVGELVVVSLTCESSPLRQKSPAGQPAPQTAQPGIHIQRYGFSWTWAQSRPLWRKTWHQPALVQPAPCTAASWRYSTPGPPMWPPALSHAGGQRKIRRRPCRQRCLETTLQGYLDRMQGDERQGFGGGDIRS